VKPKSALLAAVLCASLLASSCASLDFDRTTPTSGRFRSSAWSFTILSVDIPGPAQAIARRNVTASGRTNLQVESEIVVPHLGWFDILLDIVSIRYAKVSGTWGFPPEG